MGFQIKKIFFQSDMNPGSLQYEKIFSTVMDFSSLDSVIDENFFPPLGEGVIIGGNLINDNQFNQVVKLGPYGLYFLSLRENFYLYDIETDPKDIEIDIYNLDKQRNALSYLFYNISIVDSVIIKAKVKDDNGETCQKLKTQVDDPLWRAYFVKKAMKPLLPGTRSKKDIPPIMNASEVAAYMGIKEKTVRNWTSKKTIPFTKIGGSVRYKKDDIDEFLKSKSIHPKSKKNKK